MSLSDVGQLYLRATNFKRAIDNVIKQTMGSSDNDYGVAGMMYGQFWFSEWPIWFSVARCGRYRPAVANIVGADMVYGRYDRTPTARRFVSLTILLSHSTSHKVIRNNNN